MAINKILVNVHKPKSNDRRTKLTVELIREFHIQFGQPLYFYIESGAILATAYLPQSKTALFSVKVDGENRTRLTEAKLKKIGAAFGDVLEFEFIDRDKAIVNVLPQGIKTKKRIISPVPRKEVSKEKRTLRKLENPESEEEQSSIEKSIKSGFGFGNPETNRKVEIAAVSHITQWYESRGWKVESKETEKIGYDLLCMKGSSEEHVEVKGRQGNSPSFIITAGEVKQAKSDPDFVICIVTSALKEERQTHRLTGEEFIEKYELSPIAYRAIKNG